MEHLFSPASLPLVLAVTVLLSAPPAAAEVAEVLVVPAGSGEALGPTVAVARALVKELNREEVLKKARLGYIGLPLPPRSTKLGRKADKLAARAARANRNMAVSQAKKQFKKALSLYKGQIKCGMSPKKYIETLHQMAAMAQLDEKFKTANKYMNDAVIFGGGRPNTDRFDKGVQRLFDGVASESPGKGTVVVSVSPPAMIWFNGRLHGLAQGKIKKRAGLYLVQVFRPGHVMFQKWMRIHPHKERELLLVLNQDNSPDPEELVKLRGEARAKRPGNTVAGLALERAASQVVVVLAAPGCTAKRCKVAVAWYKDDLWKRRKVYRFNAKTSARKLAKAFVAKKVKKKVTAVASAGSRSGDTTGSSSGKTVGLAPTVRGVECTLDVQCGFKQECVNGRCIRPQPVTRKWWFWTLVGAAVVGATVGIAVPLSQPDNPVIEVK